jgi:hypothetical protein
VSSLALLAGLVPTMAGASALVDPTGSGRVRRRPPRDVGVWTSSTHIAQVAPTRSAPAAVRSVTTPTAPMSPAPVRLLAADLGTASSSRPPVATPLRLVPPRRAAVNVPAPPGNSVEAPTPGTASIRPMALPPTAGSATVKDQTEGRSIASGTGGGFVTSEFSESGDPGSSGSDDPGSSGSDGPNRAPYIWDDHASSVAFGTAFSPGIVEIDVLQDDFDLDGDTITLTGFSQPAHGTVTMNPDGKLVYKTNEVMTTTDGFQPFVGQDSFTYTATDGHYSGGATVYIDVVKVKVDIELRQSGTLTASPESGIYQSQVNWSGTDVLGPMQVGTGRADPPFKDNSYVCQTEMVGTVMPAGAIPFQYSWENTLQYRMWDVKSDGNGGWVATQFARGGFPTPADDDPGARYADTSPDQNTKHIFMTDTSGVYLVPSMAGVGDFVRAEKQFVFQVTVTQGGTTKTAGKYEAYQTIRAKRTGNTGVTANDWQGQQNSYQQGTTDCKIDTGEGEAAVGGGTPPPHVTIDPGANN